MCVSKINLLLILMILMYSRASVAREDLAQETLFLDVYLNGSRVHELLEVERIDNQFWLDVQVLSWLPFQVELSAPPNRFDICQLADITCEYNAQLLRLNLTLPASYFKTQKFDFGRRTTPELSRLSSTLLNYDAYYSESAYGTKLFDIFHDLRHSGNWGVLQTKGLYRPLNERMISQKDRQSDYTRLETYWQINNESKMRVYRFGDFVSSSSTVGPQARMAGFQVLSDFSLEPGFVSYPYPQFSGEVILPSSVDIFINGIRQYSNVLEPGPFTIDATNALVGVNEATVVTRDFRGNLVSQPVRFYFSPNLLREGVVSYAAQVGFLRKDFGIESNSYGDSLISIGDFAYGVNNSNTISSHLELGDGLKNLGFDWQRNMDRFGVLGLTSLYGTFEDDSGFQWQANYRFSTRAWAVYLEHRIRDEGYADITSLVNTNVYEEQSRASLSMGLPIGNLGLSYFRIKPFNRQADQILSASLSKSFPRFSLNVSTNYEFDSNNKSINLFVSIPIDRYGRASIRHSASEQSNSNTLVSFSSNRHLDDRLQYGFTKSLNNDFLAINGAYRSDYMELSAGHSRSESSELNWARARGSLVFATDELFFSTPVHDGFAIVDTNGFSGIPIRKENRLVGRTNENGRLLVSGINAYNTSRFSLDTEALPLNVHIRSNKANIATARSMGGLVSFEITYSNAALLIIHKNGVPVQIGSTATINGHAELHRVGWDGELYLENLAAENVLEISTADMHCTIEFPFSNINDVVPVLGPLECLEE